WRPIARPLLRCLTSGAPPIDRPTSGSMPTVGRTRSSSAFSIDSAGDPFKLGIADVNLTTRVRYLVISDIHGNLPALAAVLRDCPPEMYDRLLVLGDLVGYGAEPGAVIDRVRALTPHVVVRGNHDKAVCGLMELHAFNSHARDAALWTTR